MQGTFPTAHGLTSSGPSPSSNALVVAAWVAFGFTVSVDGGVGGRLTFVAYTVVIYTLVVVVLTVVVAVPISLAWTRLMERMARR